MITYYLSQINPDGHCLFSAIADQLVLLGLLPSEKATHAAIRTKAVEYISSHRDEFIPFLAVPETEVVEGGLMNTNQFEAYCEAMRNTATWGGEPEIFALARAFDLPIHVIQSTKPNIVVHEPEGGSRPGQHPIRVSYHRHQFGLGEVGSKLIHQLAIINYYFSTTIPSDQWQLFINHQNHNYFTPITDLILYFRSHYQRSRSSRSFFLGWFGFIERELSVR